MTIHTNNPNKVIIGRIGSAFGVRGWVKIISFTDPPENILNYSKWQTSKDPSPREWQILLLESGKATANGVVAKLKNYDDRDQAKTLTHTLIAVDRSELPKLAAEEYYWHDLIGLKVMTVDGIELGHVKELLATGSNDVLIVQAAKKEHLIPYISSVIKSVDLNNQQIVVDWEL